MPALVLREKMMQLRGLFQKKNQKVPDPAYVTIVSGLPRSGTSMMMKMLEAGGVDVFVDHIRQADGSNPKGYYEFERVKKLPEGDVEWVDEARGKTVKIISALLEHLPMQYDYRVIFMRRNMQEILDSQRAMLLRSGKPSEKVSDEHMAALFQKHLEKVEAWLESQPNMQVLYISYNDLLSDPEIQVDRLITFLGRRLDGQSMLKVIDRNLYRQRQAAP